ncbi:MAG TPA: DUF2182 domain-containing protein, partial [Longimicrobiaceae bacterium]|nr:DUF2182 domain-containing protein [Longimicrobiaceae bacterium]
MLTVRGDRGAVIVMLAALVGASWGYLVYLSREMALMDPMLAMPMARTWSVTDLLLLWLMWSIMMVAMMLPSAAPMILLFASIQRSRREQARPYVPTGFFIGGYILVWGMYSILAAMVQWGMHEAALLSPGMVSTSAILGGSLLVGAGLFQFTPLKDACLSTCRSPVNFLSTQWREGARGGWAMGIRHGAYCVGCCWMLMA